MINSFSSYFAYFFRIHLRLEEKLVVEIGRDGGVRNLEVHGFASLRISDEKFGRIRVCLENKDQRGIQLQACQLM